MSMMRVCTPKLCRVDTSFSALVRSSSCKLLSLGFSISFKISIGGLMYSGSSSSGCGASTEWDAPLQIHALSRYPVGRYLDNFMRLLLRLPVGGSGLQMDVVRLKMVPAPPLRPSAFPAAGKIPALPLRRLAFPAVRLAGKISSISDSVGSSCTCCPKWKFLHRDKSISDVLFLQKAAVALSAPQENPL